MVTQYIKFFINGGLLGIVAWALQLGIYKLILPYTEYSYAVASCLTYMPLVFVNFLIQKSLIFKRAGLFIRFFIANMFIMLIVSGLSHYLKILLDVVLGNEWGAHGGFLFASILGSIPSFLIKRNWVFSCGDLKAQ